MNDDELTRVLRRIDEPAEPDQPFADALFARLQSEVARGSRNTGPAWLSSVVAASLVAVALGLGVAVGTGLMQLPTLVGAPDESRSPAGSAAPDSTAPGPSGPGPASAEPSSAAPSPTPPASPSPRAGTLAHDSIVRTTVDALSIRSGAGRDAASYGTLASGATSFLVDGPVQADGHAWYLVSGLGLAPATGCGPGGDSTEPYTCPIWFGWVAGADTEGTAWLEPAPLDCPEPAGQLQELTGGLPPLELLHCYGDRELSFRAWWPEEEGTAFNCDPAAAVSWLACPQTVLGYDPGYWEAIGVAVNPETGPAFPERGQWVRVTAHLDDPAAAECGEPEQVLHCRRQWVITAVEPASAP